jgi:hypothetical protein
MFMSMEIADVEFEISSSLLKLSKNNNKEIFIIEYSKTRVGYSLQQVFFFFAYVFFLHVFFFTQN